MITHVLRLMLFSAVLLLILSACLADHLASPPLDAADGKAAYFADAPVYAPDGKSLATARTWRDGPIHDVPIHDVLIWDVKTGRLRHRIVLPHRNDPGDILFSPDSRMLAVTVTSEFESEIELYNVETGKRVRALPVDWITHGKQNRPARGLGHINSTAFSPDGTTLAVATYMETEEGNYSTDRVLLMSVATGRVTRVLGTDRVGCSAAAFSPDGETLATLDNYSAITFRSPRTGRRRSSFTMDYVSTDWPGHSMIQFSADGKLLLINNDRVSLYSAHSLRLLWERKPSVGVAAAAFSPDGRVVAYAPGFDSSDAKQRFFIRFCNSRSGHIIGDIPVRDDVRSIAFSPDGKWLTAQTDSSVRHWPWKAVLAASAHHNHSNVSISHVRSQARLPI